MGFDMPFIKNCRNKQRALRPEPSSASYSRGVSHHHLPLQRLKGRGVENLYSEKWEDFGHALIGG